MLTVDEAKKIIEENYLTSKIEKQEVEKSLNRILAENVYSPLPSPLFNNSAMDGFAAKWKDVKSANEEPIKLKIAGESSAGIPSSNEVENGAAIRISTGAMVPESCDVVIPIEELDIVNNEILVKRVKSQFQHIRFKGEEFKAGQLLLRGPCKLTPPKLGLLTSMGITEIDVYQKPKVSIITTGSELVKPGGKLSEGQIFDSNTIMLKSAVESAGGIVQNCLSAKDNLKTTIDTIESVKDICDIILFSGGVSVGPHDHVKDAAEKTRFKKLFWKVEQKPGKPLFMARNNETLLFGLPGNPVSALMCFTFYLIPVFSAFENSNHKINVVKLKSNQTKENRFSRAHFMRVKIDKTNSSFKVFEQQGSNMLTSVSEADGFILLNKNENLEKDCLYKVYLFPWS